MGPPPRPASPGKPGTVPSWTGIFTSPASSPFVSVVIVCAETGCAARANPAASDVTTKSRREKSDFGCKLTRSSCIGACPPGSMECL